MLLCTLLLRRPTFLNLGLNVTSQAKDGSRLSPPNKRQPRQSNVHIFFNFSSQYSYFPAPRMKTVHEEKVPKPDSSSAKEDKEDTCHQATILPTSRTCEELAPKSVLSNNLTGNLSNNLSGNSPSLVSSGYGSQAESSTNLSR